MNLGVGVHALRSSASLPYSWDFVTNNLEVIALRLAGFRDGMLGVNNNLSTPQLNVFGCGASGCIYDMYVQL